MDIEAIVGVIALVVAIGCTLSGAYVYYVYSQRNEEAPFLTRLVHRDIRVSIAAAVIAAVIAWSNLVGPLGREWGSVIIGGALIVLMYGPIGDALLWRKERRLGMEARLTKLTKRVTAAETRTTDEMQRTDEHQVVQDQRIEELEP